MEIGELKQRMKFLAQCGLEKAPTNDEVMTAANRRGRLALDGLWNIMKNSEAKGYARAVEQMCRLTGGGDGEVTMRGNVLLGDKTGLSIYELEKELEGIFTRTLGREAAERLIGGFEALQKEEIHKANFPKNPEKEGAER